MTADSGDDQVLDLAFALNGRAVADDYAELLWSGLHAALPWLEDDPAAGVHPLYGTSPGQGEQYLSRRSRLMLRLGAANAARARALCGMRLELGSTVEVGAATVRLLAPARVLYSPFVDVGACEEQAFLAECGRLLAALGIEAKTVAGKARAMTVAGKRLEGYSLMLYGMDADASLRLQHGGLGSGRKFCCGIFVPHKSVAAVGE